MRKRLWVALAAQLILASSCSTQDIPDAGSGSVRPPGTPSPPPTGPGTPASTSPHEREIRGGSVHNVAITGLNAVTADPSRLADAVQAELRGRLGAIRAGDFIEVHRNTSTSRAGARLQFVTLRQTVGGIPIDDTYLHVGIRFAGNDARLVSSSYRVFEQVSVDTTPAIARDRAVALAQQSLRLRTPVAPRSAALVVHRLEGSLQLAWSFSFAGSYQRAFVIASGIRQGRVVAIDQRVYETTGTVTGPVVRGGAPGGLGVVETDPFPNVQISGGGAQVSASGTGTYTIDVPAGTPITASLAGKASTVIDQAGAAIVASGTAVDGGATNLVFDTTTETGLAQVNAYFFVDQVRGFLEQNGMDPALFGAPLPTHTNLDDTCNAFYDPGARSINFFRSGGGCNNSAIDTVIAHEYGHFVDDINGGIESFGLSEGWGDLLACLWSRQPLLGFDLEPGQAIRNCQNDYVYPPGGVDEAHNLGQAWQGFGWDVRQNLIAQLGPAGEDLARALILPSFQSNAPDIPAAVREVFLRDDDDGDLANLTPHWDALIAAANHHGLGFTVTPDTTPPSPVTDLAFANLLPTNVNVQWTASGDDGTIGTAASYDLRWSTSPITPENFAAATPIPTGTPRPSGTVETAAFIVPSQSPVFVALVVADEESNVSPLSNVISGTTPAGEQVFVETVEGDTSTWTAKGLWHVTTRRAADGSHAFWYGREATGTYDTPDLSNQGDLISPIIDLSGVNSPVLVFDQFIITEPLFSFDLAQVIVTDVDDPNHTLTFEKDTTFSTAFVARVLTLSGFDGRRVTLTFRFSTLDAVDNAFEGWYVDHLRVLGFAACAHDVCTAGPPLEATCSSCAQQVCALNSSCCTDAWSALCVAEAASVCNTTCATCGNGVCEPGETQTSCPQDCTPACTHDECDPGVALEPACDSCAGNVCAGDPFCCNVFWDRICVQESEAACGKVCEGCAHDACNAGDPLASNCDSCATSVCAADPYCCTTGWDSRCVQEAANGCGLACTVCSHSLCSQGTPLETTCDPCAGAVCAADPYCCNNTWDQRCIDESQTTCGLTCATERSTGAPRAPTPSR